MEDSGNDKMKVSRLKLGKGLQGIILVIDPQ